MLTPFKMPAMSALCVTLGLSVTAAGTAAETNSLTLEEIIVTAQRTESSLQKTPIAVTALSSQDLAERNVNNLIDVANYTPSLNIGARGASGGAVGVVTIRGIGVAAAGSSPGVGMYVDNVYYPSSFGTLLGVFDLQRVEVLRGPQGTLFGRNTIGGAIQYISVKPSSDEGGSFVEGSVGSEDSYSIGGALNLPLGDTLAMRISAQKTQTGGYIHDNLNNVDRGRDITSQGRVQLRWTPTDKLSVDLKAEGLKSETNGRPITVGGFTNQAAIYQIATGQLPAGNLPPQFQEPNKAPPAVDGINTYTTAGFNAPDFFETRFNNVNGTIGYAITDNLELRSISAYSDIFSQQQTDFDGTPLAIIAVKRQTENTDLFTQELQLIGVNFDERLHWTLGGYYYNSKLNGQGAYTAIAYSPVTLAATSELKTVSKAVYGQATYNITPAISGTLGMRYSKEDISGAFPELATLASPSSDFTDTSPYYGLNWQVNDDTLLYAKASKGFRAGGFSLNNFYLADPNNTNYQNGALFFAPETAWNYELGGRFTLLNGRIRVNPTVFQTDWTNLQFTNADAYNYPNPPAGPGRQQVVGARTAGDAQLRGFELETQFSATERLQIFASYSYLQAEYTRLDPTLTAVQISGIRVTSPVVLKLTDPPIRSPENKFSVGTRYKHPFANGSDVVANVDYSYTSGYRSAVDGTQNYDVASYGLLGARVAFHPANLNFELALYGTNLLDEYYMIDATSFQTTQGTIAFTVGRPLEGGVSLKYAF